MATMLSTKEVAAYLGVNEKMVYTLIAEKGLPGSKVTGKWVFPQHLVDQWIETSTINYPKAPVKRLPDSGMLIIVGSNDPLLDRTLALFNKLYPDDIAVFGNLGSMGGLRALRQNRCHMATSHLLEENESDYNFSYVDREVAQMPAIVNFCRREQGVLLASGNPKRIASVADLGKTGMRLVNRSLQTGTRLLFDHELKKAGLNGPSIDGYANEVSRHIDVGLEILAGRADAGPCIRPIADMLGLDFIPLRWERYDLLIDKDHFFDQIIQNFLGIFREDAFAAIAESYRGYDISISGKMVFQG